SYEFDFWGEGKVTFHEKAPNRTDPYPFSYANSYRTSLLGYGSWAFPWTGHWGGHWAGLWWWDFGLAIRYHDYYVNAYYYSDLGITQPDEVIGTFKGIYFNETPYYQFWGG